MKLVRPHAVKFKNRFNKIISLLELNRKWTPKQINDVMFIVLDRYDESHRFYHTLEHINESLDIFVKVHGLCNSPANVFLAILFHDIVYEIGSQTNEWSSAQVMYQTCHKFEGIDPIAIHYYIEETKDHKINADNDCNIVRDIDLAILGERGTKFMTYNHNIEYEYFKFAEVFAEKRLAFLKSLDVDNLYATQYFKDRYGHRAKLNINTLIIHYEKVVKKRLNNSF